MSTLNMKAVDEIFGKVLETFKDTTGKDATDKESERLKNILMVRFSSALSLVSPKTPSLVVKLFLKDNPIEKYKVDNAFFEKQKEDFVKEHNERTGESLKKDEIIIKKTENLGYTRNEAFFEAHNEKVRKQYMDEHDGRTPEEDGVIYIVLK